MFKPTIKRFSSFIGLTALLGITALLAYAAVFFPATTQPIGYVGQPTLSNYNVTSGLEKIYRGMFNNFDWSGQFSCYPVSATGYVNLASPCFTSGAGSPLDIQAASGVRMIGTLSDATTPAGVEFSTTGLTTTQQTALGSAANINWIRGTSLSPTGLRSRATVLGDIIHSRPYYWPDAANNNANPTVFVGANDGMLHAFNATTGTERWAYVPSMLISASKMAMLPSASYTHDYFVDGSMAIGNVPSTGTTPVLVGALGAGGKGLYALSLASLTAASGTAAGSKALWEITNTGIKCGPASTGCSVGTNTYANLGYTYSNPVIKQTQDGSTSVIVGNGYNNTGNGHASLYVINAATGALIREIDTGVGSTTSPNGLSSVATIDSNGDGMADRAYAGDINGNMWVFDLSSASASSWQVAIVSGTTPQPLFTAAQGTYPEPIAITIRPVISAHPLGGYMVNFATGRILSQAGAGVISPSTAAAIDDTTDQTTPYAAYGLWDNPLVHTTIPVSSLLTQALTSSTYTTPAGTTIPVIHLTTDNQPNWATHRGWTVPLLLQGGERVTGDKVILDNGKFIFNVTNPAVAYTPPGATASTYGVNYLVELDYLYGGAGTVPFLDLNQDGLFNSSDLLTGTTTIATLIPVGYITSNGVQSQPILIDLGSSRISLYNQNYNVTNSGNAGTGVNGGHFDVDSFYAGGGGFQKITHVHEYDKTYDTNGLNPLNPNNSTYRLSAVPSITATTAYKILVMNQGWNRAMNLRIGTWAGSTRDYQTMRTTDVISNYNLATCAAATASNLGVGCLDVVNLPEFTGVTSQVGHLSGATVVATSGTDYTVIPNTTTTDVAGKVSIVNVVTTGSIGCRSGATGSLPSGCTTTTKTAGARASVGGLELSMPSNGFNIQDWWGDTVKQTGVMPLTPGCAYGDTTTSTVYPGLHGERHDGVLTVQIIKTSTPNADVRMNVPGSPIYGFRVIDSKISTDVLAEFTLYWHHPNAECMGNTQKWATTNNPGDPWWPAQETSPAASPASCSSGYVKTTGGGSCTACPTGQTANNTLRTCSGGGTYQTAGTYTAAVTGFTSSTANSTSTTKGILTCVTGGPNNASGTPTWKTTANAAANTAPYSGSTGNTTGPAGWTIAPPQDSATTLPPCPSYNQLYDDPRTASFINPTSGSNGSSTAPATSTAVTAISSGMGGNTGGAAGGSVTPASGSSGAASGVPDIVATSGVLGTGGNTPISSTNKKTFGRINWRELIGL